MDFSFFHCTGDRRVWGYFMDDMILYSVSSPMLFTFHARQAMSDAELALCTSI